MNLLDLKNISKSYKSSIDQSVILQNVNLSIKKKENIFLFGPSGCGKSTLLNILSGLDDPDAGEIYFENKIVKKYNQHLLKNDISIVFQDHYLISELNIYDNIFLKCKKKEEINEILEYLDLIKLKNKFPSQLSNGQKQRVCVARALANKPKFLIADEPTSYLDRKNANLVINLIIKASLKYDISTIVASHDMSFQSNFHKSYTIENMDLVLC
tara:strand:- start:8652 stop:9290 length:639 start_codon:yes stop_codon:yes gene_type:complete